MTVYSSSESGLIVTDARKLLRGTRFASLATLDHEDGHPYASLVAVATALDGAPILLISDLAVHTRNIKKDPRISIVFAAESVKGKDPLNSGRVSVMGTAATTDVAMTRNRFLARHPDAALYAGFGDFSFYEMAVSHAHYVGGFGRISSVAADDLLLKEDTAKSWQPQIEETMRLINSGHKDLLARLAGQAAEMVACDPDGFDVAAGDAITRFAFAERLASPGEILPAMRQIDP